jgi:flagellar hook assembly protein FlgD
VRATDEKLPGPWSDTRSFTVDTTPPRVLSVISQPDPFSPDADGTDDSWSLSVETDEEVSSALYITSSTGEAVRTLAEPVVTVPQDASDGTVSTFNWDGRDDSASMVPDGQYTWYLEGQDVVGHILTLSGTVEVDTSIDLEILSAEPNPFNPRDPGAGDTLTVTYSLGREADIEAEIYKEGNLEEPIYTISEAAKPSGENTLTWDGSTLNPVTDPLFSPDDWRVEDGKYFICIKATTACGGWEEGQVEAETVSTPLSIGDISVEPEVISPNGDGSSDSCTLAFDLTEEAYLTLNVRGPEGLGVARPVDDCLYAAGRVEIAWDGTFAAGGYVPNGSYSFFLAAFTERGKAALAQSTVEVESQLPSEALVPRVALASSEPNHPGEPSRFEVELPENAEQAFLELDGQDLQLAKDENGRWWCEVANTAGNSEAVVRALDSSGQATSTPVVLELAGYAGEHHLTITDDEDFRSGSTDAGLFDFPGWLANYSADWKQAWQQMPPSSQIASSLSNATVTYDGKIYIFGWGSAVWVFDPADSTYELVAQAPENLSMPSAAVSGGLIYVCGGGTYWDRSCNFLYAFDPGSGSFTPLAPMPELRNYNTMAAAAGKLYVLGGRNYSTGEYPSEILAYDIATDTWAQEGSLPEGVTANVVPLHSLSREGRILFIGGPRDFYEAYGLSPAPVWEFTPGGGWRVVALVPLPLGVAVTQTEEGDLLIAGGAAIQLDENTGSSMKILPSAYLFSPDDSTLRALPDLNEARYYSSAAVVQGKVFVFGGMGTSGYLRSVECLDLSGEAPALAAATWQSPVYDLGADYELVSVGSSCTGSPSVALSFSEDGENWQDLAIPASGGDIASAHTPATCR